MTAVEIPCPACRGCGYVHPPPDDLPWLRCAACDGIGRTWAPGAPSFGCSLTLGDRVRGEIVTLGNGDHGRILRHSKSGTPTTYLGLIGEFDGVESHTPVCYPSCIGVASVSVSRLAGDTNDHAKSRTADLDDPLQRGLFYSVPQGG